LEQEMDSGDFTPDPGQIIANRPVSFRAYIAESDFFNRPRTVSEIERHITKRDFRYFVERLRINGEIT
ncbi:MAG: aspartate-alanine antiporter, partial [Paramuribaculum sp.]|nr:aspartate-alanine antiporter [Paramuribaculum sp.]